MTVLKSGGWQFSWSAVPEATSYVLERDVTAFVGDRGKADETSVVLTGDATSATLPDGPWHSAPTWEERFTLTASTPGGSVVLTNDTSCPDAFYLAARGSGQNAEPAYAAGLGNRGANVFNDIKSYLSVGASAIRPLPVLGTYLAVDVNIKNDWRAPYLMWSANQGTGEALKLLDQVRTNCAGTPVLMFGYSQGAWVVGDALTQALTKPTSHARAYADVAKLMLLADARYGGKLPNVSYYPYDHLGSGSAGARGPIGASAGVVTNYCFPYDIVCNNTATQFHTQLYSCYEKRVASDGAQALSARLGWALIVPPLTNCDVRGLNGRTGQYNSKWYLLHTNPYAAAKAITAAPLAGAATRRCLTARGVPAANQAALTAVMSGGEEAIASTYGCVDPNEIRSRAVAPPDSLRPYGYWVGSDLAIRKIPDVLSATCYDEKSGVRRTLRDVTAYEFGTVGGLVGTMPYCLGPKAASGKILRLASTQPSAYIVYIADSSGVRHHVPDVRTLACLVYWGRHPSINNLTWAHVRSLSESTVKATCTPPADLAQTIVRDPVGKSYFVDSRLVRHSITTSATWWCLVDRGFPVRDVSTGQVNGIVPGAAQSECVSASRVEGRIIRRNDGVSWVVVNGERRHIPSLSVDVCARAVHGRTVALSGLSFTAAASIPEGSGYNCSVEGTILQVIDRPEPYPAYRISAGKRYWIPDGWTFRYWKQRLPVIPARGESIVKELPDAGTDVPRIDVAQFPRNVIVKQVGSTAAYYIDASAVRHWIPSGSDYICMNRWRQIPLAATLYAQQLSAFAAGANQTCSTSGAYNKVLRVAASGAAYFIDGSGTRHWIPNGGTYNCMTAWRGYRVLDGLTEGQLSAFASGANQSCTVPEAYNHILRVGATGRSYYVDGDGIRHWIPNGGTFLCLQYWKAAPLLDGLSDAQVDTFATGSDQSCSVPEAYDSILRVGSTGASYYLDGSGAKHWIPNGGTFLCLQYWKGKRIYDNLLTQHVDTFATGSDQSCSVPEAYDSILRVGSTGASYYLDGSGVKHWIPNGGTFLCLQYWKGKRIYDNLLTQHVDTFATGSDQSCSVPEAYDSILRVGSTGASYYLDGSGVKHWIPNGGTFLCLQYWKGKRIYDNLLTQHVDTFATGSNQSCSVPEAYNTVIRESTTGTAYFVDGSGVRHWIQDGATYNCLVKYYPLYHDLTWNHINALAEGAWQPRTSC